MCIHLCKHLEIPPHVLHGVAPSISLVNKRVPNTWTVSAKSSQLQSDFTYQVGQTEGTSHDPRSAVGER